MSTTFEALAYSRLTFGPFSQDRNAPTPPQVWSWIASQLNAPGADAPIVQNALSAVQLEFVGVDANGVALPPTYLPLTTLWQNEATLWSAYKAAGSNFPMQVRPAQEIQCASYIRAMLSPNQLFEMMVDFWHSHFNVNCTGSGVIAASFPQFDQIIRAHALGNFHDMLVAVAQSVSMMYYLNQVESTGAHPNENFAREVMELHTLGAARYLGLTTPSNLVGQGYSDQDVQQAAQILAGWTISQTDGSFYFNTKIHNAGDKTLLGQTIPSGGVSEGMAMFNLLVSHPGTANTIATKLYRRFIGDYPPANSPVITAMQNAYLANVGAPNQIALVLYALISSDEFAASSGQKIKTPFEFIVSLLRAVNLPILPPVQAPLNPTGTLNYELNQMGDPRYAWVPPNGRPDIALPWMSNGSLLQRIAAAEDILSINGTTGVANAGVLTVGWSGLFDLLRRVTPNGPINLVNAGQAVSRAVVNMLPHGVSPTTLSALNVYASSTAVLGNASVFSNPTLLLSRLGMLIATVAATPEFQFRG